MVLGRLAVDAREVHTVESDASCWVIMLRITVRQDRNLRVTESKQAMCGRLDVQTSTADLDGQRLDRQGLLVFEKIRPVARGRGAKIYTVNSETVTSAFHCFTAPCRRVRSWRGQHCGTCNFPRLTHNRGPPSPLPISLSIPSR